MKQKIKKIVQFIVLTSTCFENVFASSARNLILDLKRLGYI